MILARQILYNLLMAIVWMLLQNSSTIGSFLFGYGMGLLVLWVLHLFGGYELYTRRVYALIKLIILFFKELIMANIAVFKTVLRPKISINPGIVEVCTELKHPGEVVLLAVMITLTPGTLSINLSPDNHSIYVHALDVPDRESMIEQIRHMEKAIMEVTRPCLK